MHLSFARDAEMYVRVLHLCCRREKGGAFGLRNGITHSTQSLVVHLFIILLKYNWTITTTR